MELSGTWCLRRTADAKLKRQQAESVVGVPTPGPRLARCSPDGVEAWFYLRLLAQRPGLTAFWGCPRGHRVAHETCSSLSRPRILTLEPERFSGMATAGFHPQWLHWFRAQAACVFSLAASKLSPFFQMVRATAAILRARVRRAISGWMPLLILCW